MNSAGKICSWIHRNLGLFKVIAFGSFLGCLQCQNSLAIFSFQTTLSSGFFRNPNNKAQVPTLFNWDLSQASKNGVESNISLGVNNTLVDNQWSFSVYQATVNVPLRSDNQFQDPNPSVAVLGRSMLIDGFEMSPLDGAQIHWALDSKSGLKLVAGTLSSLDDPASIFETRIFGGSIHGNYEMVFVETGFYDKQKDSQTADLWHASIQSTSEVLPLKPSIILRSQWLLPKLSLDQFMGELSLFPSDHFAWILDYSSRQPNPLDPSKGSWIYQLFAMNTQEAVGSSVSWELRKNQRLEMRAEKVSFDSQSGPESGYQLQASYQLQIGRYSLSPGTSYLSSYGGKALLVGISGAAPLTQHTDARASLDVAHIDKINGIEGMAYHARGGLRFQLGPHLFAQSLLELERNHLFSMDARFVIYVSRFYF